MFADRHAAGSELAQALLHLRGRDPLVLALPRGGVPVAAPVARQLGAPLDVVLVRKIGAPWSAEVGIGALVEGEPDEVVWLDRGTPPLNADYLEAAVECQRTVLAQRRQRYRGGRPLPSLTGRTVIVVDDGIATGSTVRAALQALRGKDVAYLVLAVPVAPRDVVEALRAQVDELVCLRTPQPFHAVGLHYRDFAQLEDAAVLDELAAWQGGG
ncbi:phosphoribosyltransferase family protein [Chitiniphilus purpureus]|uniref:Phosphoribosyltransferase family protein n=1 Tax=Chitiniphilus purpureus TaxID=2981137 RepID=A0ABY6DQI0_9NEIS|nr:phosphoribosyltransferase family protein [Chitiniphilus sp. CD1]UXY16292.1 phosphoribosyltransferase family protein [Chitiniphilus sp. CD1]